MLRQRAPLNISITQAGRAKLSLKGWRKVPGGGEWGVGGGGGSRGWGVAGEGGEWVQEGLKLQANVRRGKVSHGGSE